jgi:hypothetical protein
MMKEVSIKAASIMKKITLEGTGPDTSTHQQKASLMDPAAFTTHIWIAKEFPII